MKIRAGLAVDDYKDPGDYKHPAGTVAYEVATTSAPPATKTGNPTNTHDMH